MYQKKCRLTIAAKYYGKGGGGGSIPATVVKRNVSKEWPAVKNWSERWSGQEYPQFRENEPLLKEMYSQATEDLGARGALTPEQEGQVRTSTLATAGAMGMGNTPATLGTELLNREQYRQQREDRARQFAQGTLTTGVSAFGGLTNPILEYLTHAFTPQVVGGTAAPSDNKGSATVGAAGTVIGAAIPVIAGI